MRRFFPFSRPKRGTMLVFILIFGTTALFMIISGVASYALFEHRASLRRNVREKAFHVAEAGANYYRWHLAHDGDDYTDGTGLPGPYVREYRDQSGDVIGYYSLEIDPPLVGSTVATIRSTGWMVEAPETTRTVQIRLGQPSLANHTFLQNGPMRFSSTTIVSGSVQSNSWIEFNGTTNAAVRSAIDTYVDVNTTTRNGVWGNGGPQEFFEFPVPSVDFFSITSDLSEIRSNAISSGAYIAPSGRQGWRLTFRSDGRYDLHRVNNISCYNSYCYDIGSGGGALTNFGTFTIPANGSIFVEDQVWVRGTVNGRLVIGASAFPIQSGNYRDIIISDNLIYQTQGGDDVIGLIASRDVIVPRNVPTDMTIHAAAIAQNGSIGRPYYFHNRNSLTFFGSQIAYANTYGWKQISVATGQVISGFVNTNHIYDGNLQYYPPPGFPKEVLFDLISWEEVE